MEDTQIQISPLMVVVLILALAGLDLLATFVAKEWTLGRSAWFLVAGFATFVVLFGVYAAVLKYVELSTVTFGWIVSIQVAVLVLERVRYEVNLPPGKWVAIVGLLALQGYLMLAPNGAAASADGALDAGSSEAAEQPVIRVGQLAP